MKNIGKLLIICVVVILANLIVSQLYFRLDLTSEKRHTLNDATIETLESVSNPIVLEVFLEGDLPASFLNLKRRLEDLLEEYKNYSGENVIVKWVDPSVGNSEADIKKRFQQIANAGVKPFTLQERKSDGKMTQRIVFPGAFISTEEHVVSVNFLQSKFGANLDENILLSEQLLEYECTAALKKLLSESINKVAIVTGEGYPDKAYLASASQQISEFYPVVHVSIEEAVLDTTVQTLLIAKPTKPFTEADKYYIDKFVQAGKSVLWFLDASLVSMDSLAFNPVTMAFAQSLNVEDILFKYGVRINYSLVLDNQCATIPINVAPAGEKAQFNPAPWYYAPLLSANSDHPVSGKLNVIKSQFVSVLDTVGGKTDFTKEVLLTTSSYSRVHSLPTPVGFDVLDQVPNERFFNRYKQVVSVLHEGVFPSLYANRKSPTGVKPLIFSNYQAVASKQIFVADGDVVLNEVKKIGKDTIPLKLGYDRYTKQTYGNAEFVLNAINYLNGDDDLLRLRTRELKLRLLDRTRIVSERKFWQVLNIAGPLALLLVSGGIFFFVRKRKYYR